MYRTDKQFMTNPATAGSRVYIGCLPKTVVAQDLEEKFTQYGKILGLVLQTGFAFIQYENESQAHAAIQNEANTIMHGRKINVKQALDKSQKVGNNQNRRPMGPGQGMHVGPSGPGPHNNSGGPGQGLHGGPGHGGPGSHGGLGHGGPGLHSGSGYGGPAHGGPGPHGGPGHNGPGSHGGPVHGGLGPHGGPAHAGPGPHSGPPPLMQQLHQPPSQQHPQIRMNQDNNPPEQPPVLPEEIENEHSEPINNPVLQNVPSKGPKNIPFQKGDNNINMDGPQNERRGKKRRVKSRDRFMQQNDYGEEPPFYGRNDYNAPKYNHPPAGPPIPPGPPVLDQPDRNDCEIIVVSKLLTKYAEYIEQRLKSLGLIVDLLFPNEDVPIGRVLANISSRGCLYAILVMPQNEEHRSLTLNILHGLPQEHRNMPIEDALILITRNFDAYMRGDKSATENTTGTHSISERHPTTMQLLLNLLAENRQLTTAQYDRLLKYLQERREVQSKHEIEEGIDQESQESNSKQAELQSRIMSILNKTSTDNPPPPPPDVSESTNDVAPPLLKDPSVQKALDSLLGGEMFKNIGVAL